MRDYIKEAEREYYTADDERKAREEQKFGEIWDAEEKKGYSREQAFIRAQYIYDGQTPPEDEKPEKEDTRTDSEIFTDILKGYYSAAFGGNK